MSEQEPTSEPKTIDVTVTKKRSSLLKYIVFFLFVAMLALLLWNIVLKNYVDYKNILTRSEISKEIIKPSEDVVVKEREEITPAAPEIVEQKPLEPLPQQDNAEILSLTGRLEKLEEQNKALTFYIAARELKEKISNPTDFGAQLEFVSSISIGEADIEGRVDLLKQASSNGLPTKDGLIAELKKIASEIENKQEKTFWGSVKNSFNGLVKVTKIKGEVDGADYQTTLKRVELALENSDYKTAAIEAENLGVDGAEFVKKINNLQRVIEITDSLVEFSKANFVADDEQDSEEVDGEVL